MINFSEIAVCSTCSLPFVIFGFKVVDGAAVEVVEGVNVDLVFWGLVVVLVINGTTFSSSDILIEVDVMMIGSSYDGILFSLESNDGSWAMFWCCTLWSNGFLFSLLFSSTGARDTDDSKVFLTLSSLNDLFASLFLDFKKLSLIAAFNLFNFPWT